MRTPVEHQRFKPPFQVERAFLHLEDLLLTGRTRTAVAISGPGQPSNYDGYLCADPIERGIRQAGVESIVARMASALADQCGDRQVTFAVPIGLAGDGELVPFDVPFTAEQRLIAVTARRGHWRVIVSSAEIRWSAHYRIWPTVSAAVPLDLLPPDTPGALLVREFLDGSRPSRTQAARRPDRTTNQAVTDQPRTAHQERLATEPTHYICGSCDRRVDPLRGCRC